MPTTRRRITLINNQGLRDNGGGPTIIRNIVARLAPWHDITIISFDPPADGIDHITQVTLPRLEDPYWRLRPFLMARHYRKTLKTALTGTPDIVIALDSHLGLAFPALPAGRRVYISLSCIPRQEWYGTGSSRFLSFLQYVFLERRMIRNADITVVASKSQRDEIARFELLPGLQPLVLGPVFARPDTKDQAINRPDDKAGRGTVFVTVSRLVDVKRVDRILEIASRLRQENCHFIIVGDGPQARVLKQAAEKRALGADVTFVGRTDHPEEFYRQADILLHPSAYESFGIAVFEAMCHGVIPVCAKGKGSTIGIADDITHRENGLLVDFEDMDAVIRDLRSLMADSVLQQRMKRQASERAREMLEQDYVGRLAEALGIRAA